VSARPEVTQILIEFLRAQPPNNIITVTDISVSTALTKMQVTQGIYKLRQKATAFENAIQPMVAGNVWLWLGLGGAATQSAPVPAPVPAAPVVPATPVVSTTVATSTTDVVQPTPNQSPVAGRPVPRPVPASALPQERDFQSFGVDQAGRTLVFDSAGKFWRLDPYDTNGLPLATFRLVTHVGRIVVGRDKKVYVLKEI
jgi:hypothetical protein